MGSVLISWTGRGASKSQIALARELLRAAHPTLAVVQADFTKKSQSGAYPGARARSQAGKLPACGRIARATPHR